MNYENVSNREPITSEFLKNFDNPEITATGVSLSKSREGSFRVINSFMDLYKPFGNKYGSNPLNISESKFLEILNKAGVTEDDVSVVMSAEIGELDTTGLKEDISKSFDRTPELEVVRDKIAGVFGGVKIEA